jgi:predicted phosphoribosyltransferase
MRFHNREHAAHLLGEKLTTYRGQHPLVLGIPRGAVPMAKIIAAALGGDLDVMLVHKLGAPGNPELAIGSVDETGRVYLSEHVCELGIDDDYLEKEKQAQLKTLQKRRAQYTPVRPPLDPAGRLVIVVDNGIATGGEHDCRAAGSARQAPRQAGRGRGGRSSGDGETDARRGRRSGVFIRTGLLLCGRAVLRGFLPGV